MTSLGSGSADCLLFRVETPIFMFGRSSSDAILARGARIMLLWTSAFAQASLGHNVAELLDPFPAEMCSTASRAYREQ